MTGKYNHRNWVAFGILDKQEKTFGHLLRQAGYRTCIAGKWQLQSYDPPDYPNADRRRGTGLSVKDAGFEEYSLFHSWNTEDKGSRYANPTYYENGTLKKSDGSYGPDHSVDFILDYMSRHRDEAMFVYYPMSLPHWPMVPTPDSAEWSDPDRRLEESTVYFPDMVAYMDKAIGRLVTGIDDLGIGNDTVVMFYSDNGTDRRITSRLGNVEIQGGKATPQQTGIRVPLIVRWPAAIKPGQTSAALIDPSDFLPTFAELGRASIPADWHRDGLSFLPSLLGQGGPKRETCFFWYDPRPGWDKENYFRHIFALDHRYKLFSDGRLFDVAGTGLREVLLDPANLSGDAEAARSKLQRVINQTLQPPISSAAQVVVDAFGNPVK